MHFEVLSLFPRYIEGPLQESILKRAIQKGLIQVSSLDIRSFSTRKDGRVDDRPYGGGPGMVMMAEPVVSAVRSCRKPSSQVICLSPRGTPLTPTLAKQLSAQTHLILLCGHYEGIDERAITSCVDLEVSIGDYVLTNGCLAALVLIDTVSRFIPGVLGHEEGSSSDSFENGILEAPQYTVPRDFEGKKVPEILFSGDHAKIQNWREGEALQLTLERRPDLVAKLFSSEKEEIRGVSLSNLVVSTAFFEKSCSFYRKISGVTPEICEGRATFSWGNSSFSLLASNLEVIAHDMLYISVTREQFKKAFSWCSAKEQEKTKRISNDTFLSLDPDGRTVVVSILS